MEGRLDRSNYQNQNTNNNTNQNTHNSTKNPLDNERGAHRKFYNTNKQDPFKLIHENTLKLQENPRDIPALLALGNAHVRLRQYNDAVKVYTSLLDFDQNNQEGLCARGIALSKRGDYEMAIQDLTYVLDSDHSNAAAGFARAACYNSMGMFALAIDDYNSALMADKNNTNNNKEGAKYVHHFYKIIGLLEENKYKFEIDIIDGLYSYAIRN